MEFALGDIVGDGDGDGAGIGDVETSGVGDRLNDVVESDDLERRDGVEGESSRSGGRKVVHGGNCPGRNLAQPGSRMHPLVKKLTIVFGSRSLTSGDDHPVIFGEVIHGN